MDLPYNVCQQLIKIYQGKSDDIRFKWFDTRSKGCMVMNLDTDSLLVNGTCGTIVNWSEPSSSGSDQKVHPIVRFETSDGKIRDVQVEPYKWEFQINDKKLAYYKQVPLKLAWAITIHKSQGMTLQRVSLDLSRTFECGQAYTGLSRVTSMDGLYLRGYSAKHCRVDEKVTEWEKKLAEYSKTKVKPRIL